MHTWKTHNHKHKSIDATVCVFLYQSIVRTFKHNDNNDNNLVCNYNFAFPLRPGPLVLVSVLFVCVTLSESTRSTA